MLPQNLPDMTCDSVYYQTGLNNWASVRDTVPDMLNYFKENMDTFVHRNHRNPWRILSIGCGNGSLDLPLLRLVTDRFPNLHVHYEGLDPSCSRLDDFRKTSSSMNQTHHRIILHQVDFEHYEDPINESDRFDLILCARVLYYMHDQLDAVFIRLFEKLIEPNFGKILIFQQSPSGLAQIAHIIGMTQQSPAHTCNTYHLRQALDRISPKYSSLYYHVIYIDKYTDMTFLANVRSKDQATRDKAINLLSFILGKDLRDVDADLLEKVVEKILASVTFETTTGGEHIMFQPIGVIVVRSRT